MLKDEYLCKAKVVLIFIGLISSLGCSPTVTSQQVTGSCSSRISVTYSGVSERNYCSTTQTHLDPVTITGTAQFETRDYGVSGLSATLTSKNIRFAEVVAYSAGGSIVQCGETDNLGQFSLQLPSSSQTYTLVVFSRGQNSAVNASVLNCPEENKPYSVSTSFIPNSSLDVGTMTASAASSGDMEGAAFNIFDQIVDANAFLMDSANAGGACTVDDCTVVDEPAPKVLAYWDKGFNPNTYFDADAGGVSFYIPGLRRLFILGGEDGDVLTSDTDHFDNSIILHEYGHFLEDVYADTDSPGGSHSGNAIIDPRLAWGEGWGNFIQAAIRSFSGESSPINYRDTFGTPETGGSTSYIFNIPLEQANAGCSVGSVTPGCDIPEFDFEGNFREFSVARLLWDVFDDDGEAAGVDEVDAAFVDLWGFMTSTSSGLKNSNLAFRNIGIIHEYEPTDGSSDWSSIQDNHKHGDTTEYAKPLIAGTCGKAFTIIPYDDPDDTGSFASSHLLRNNDFYHYNHPGGAFNLSLRATVVDSSGGYTTELEPDLDLYLYNQNGRIGNSNDIIATADNYWDNDPSTTDQTETINLSNLAAGNYLIQVRVFTGRFLLDSLSSTNNCIGSGFREICENDGAPNFNFIPAGDETDYELILNGVDDLCPSALP